jgi:hypothetical protein
VDGENEKNKGKRVIKAKETNKEIKKKKENCN